MIFSTFVAISALATLVSGCGERSGAEVQSAFSTAPAQRRELIVQVSATGTVGPIRVIEIKSKASGAILRLPVETGDIVQAGTLLAQVDTTDVAAQVRQTQADLDVARVRVSMAERKKQRTDDLLRQGMISQDEYDQTVLEYQTARATVIKTQTSLEQARERLAETVVRAPSAGTILSKKVEQGQIIASATSQVSGGTMLMMMADLTRVQVRVLVDETDLGKVRPGQHATVEVDSYPNRRFIGSILKIEPEAVTQQSITFFPVLIHIDNEESLLKPGMTANVEIHILRRENVLSVPNEAIKSLRSAVLTAPLLGLDPDSVSALFASARFERPQGGAGSPGERPPGGRSPGAGPGMGGGTGEFRPTGGPRPGGSTGQPGQRPGGDRRARMADGEGGSPPSQQTTAVVFVQKPGQIQPVIIRTGAQNWEYTEVVSGIEEGTPVVIPPSATLARQSEEARERARRWSGGGVMGRTR